MTDPRPKTQVPLENKTDLRKQVLARRDTMSAEDRRERSGRITARLLARGDYRDARCVMAYLGFGSEFDTAGFISDIQAREKTLVLPRVEKGNRQWTLHEVRDLVGDTEAGVWGIRQPRADRCPPARAEAVAFVLVPGVAFTREGARLGYGGGYYDRFIRGLARRPPLVAAAFDLQLLEALPMSDSDQWVDVVVTELGEFRRAATAT